jgi:hypothetical protein
MMLKNKVMKLLFNSTHLKFYAKEEKRKGSIGRAGPGDLY